MTRAVLWGFEKNVTVNTIPEGLYLLGLAARRAGYETEIRLLPRSYADTVRSVRARLRRVSPADRPAALAAFFDPLRRSASQRGILAHGVQAYETDLDYIVPLIDFLKSRSAAPVILGGPFPTLAPGAALEASGADALLAGECERTWPRLLRALDARHAKTRGRTSPDWRRADRIPGFGRRDPGSGAVRVRPFSFPDPIIRPPDDLDYWMAMRRLNFGARRARADCTFFLSASRGCPRGCLFCSHANGRRARGCAPDAMAARWTALRRTLMGWQARGRIGQVCLNFNDDDFLLRAGAADRMLERMARTGPFHPSLPVLASVSVPAFFRGRRLDADRVRRIADAGIRVLNIGTDAFSRREIRRLKSAAYTPGMIEELVACFERHELYNNHFWMLSGPETTVIDIVDQIRFARRLFQTYRRFLLVAANLFIIPYLGSRVRRRFPPEQHPALYRPRRFLAPAGAANGNRPASARFYDRVFPADPHARALLGRLRRFEAPGPDGYDFDGNLDRIRRYAIRHMRGAGRRDVLRRLDAALSGSGS